MSTARFIGTLPGDLEVWKRGPAMFIVDAIRDDYPQALKTAISRRRAVSLTGECPCGAELSLCENGVHVDHEDECPARDAPALLAEWEGANQ